MRLLSLSRTLSRDYGPAPGSQSGVVLVLVLVTLLALTSFVIGTVEFTTRDAGEVSLLTQEEQAGVLADGALHVAFRLLQEDKKATADTVHEPWAETWSSEGVTIDIEPCNARLNLNTLIKGDAKERKRVNQAMRRLLLHSQNSLEPLNYLLDWLDSDEEEDHDVMGSEGLNYRYLQPSYQPRNDVLARPEEVALVEGWQEFEPQWIADNFTVWGPRCKLNLNFISEETLNAFFPELKGYWPRIKAFREESGFLNKDDLLEATPIEEETYQAILPYFTVTSDVFRVLVRVDLGSCRLEKRFIVKRSNSQLIARDVLSCEF